MNVILVAVAGAVAAGWAAWLVTGWYVRMRDRAYAAERFAEWMAQERTIISTLDEIRSLPEAEVER